MHRLYEYDVIVTSYEILRRDVATLAAVQWEYCVLDEGHLIRNPNSKLSKACKRIHAQSRLVLTGTPVQNGAEELWAIFDFLMPGMLGDKAAFTSKHPSKKGKSDHNALLLGSLHRKVLPFILRRTKEDVLPDLPSKLVQDIYVEPSKVQLAIRNDAQARGIHTCMEQCLSKQYLPSANHVFEALNFFRRLWSHPLLAIEAHPAGWDAGVNAVRAACGDATLGNEPDIYGYLQQVDQAPKLQALLELLESVLQSPSKKVLVFAQSRRTLDLAEASVVRCLLEQNAYARLDGTMSAEKQSTAVARLRGNQDVRLLLLTTSAGGHGLNLSVAQTVIFLEHDWNPKRDLQAMDRAHRIGQKNTVTVFRILVRGSMEEYVMSMQNFKAKVADTIVNEDNNKLNYCTTGGASTHTVLDIIATECQARQPASGPSKAGDHVTGEDTTVAAASSACDSSRGAVASLINELDDLWTRDMYNEEFSIETLPVQS